jgi:putative flippase GtrA
MGPYRQFVLFATIGALATGAHFAILVYLVELHAWSALPASCVGALVGAVVSYWLNYHLTFRSSRPHQVTLPRFLLVATLAFVLNGTLLAVLLQSLGLHYMLAQVSTTLTILALTFSASRFWSFR